MSVRAAVEAKFAYSEGVSAHFACKLAFSWHLSTIVRRREVANFTCGKGPIMRGFTISVAMLVALAASTPAALADVSGAFLFNYVPAQSGLTATANNAIGASGTLIGNYDATTNPTGTRTKPGFFGPFGATENLPVNVNNFGVGLSGNINTDTSGSFQLAIDTNAGTISMSGYQANFLSNGPASLPLNINLSTETFRTRSPSFLYPGLPISLPIGTATISTFSITQTGSGIGTLTQTGPNTYDFVVAPLVNLEVGLSVLGNEFALPGQAPLPFALQGSLVINGNNATITGVNPISFTQATQPNQALPEIPLALPTGGDPANVLLNLTLSDLNVGFTGTANTFATGTLIPAPGSLLAVAGAGLLAVRRRR